MTRSIYALRIVKVTNRMLDRRYWKPGAWLKLTLACEQEPALGFGNFDSWDPTTLTGATFYERPLDAASRLPDIDRMGVEAEIVAFTESATSSHAAAVSP